MGNIELGPGKLYIESTVDYGNRVFLGYTIGGVVKNKKPGFRQKVKERLLRAIHNFRRKDTDS